MPLLEAALTTTEVVLSAVLSAELRCILVSFLIEPSLSELKEALSLELKESSSSG